MIGIDTNVLLAWLLKDQARQLPGTGPFRISIVVLAELIWVLDRHLKRSRLEIASIVRLLLEADAFRFTDENVVLKAIEDFEGGAADFADYLVVRDNQSEGCSVTLTSDRKAARHSGFSLID